MANMRSELTVSLWRGAEQGRYETYEVPRRENQTVLDVVTFVQRHLDPTLSYRFACRVGMCGSCAMTVNGRPRWTCRTHVSKVADGRPHRDRAAGEPAGHQGSGDRHARLLREVAAGEGRVRAVEDARRCHRADQPRQRGAHRRRRGDRMHQLRRLLRRLRHRALERRLSRAGGAQPRLDAGQRRTRCRQSARLAAVAAAGGCHACHSHQSCQEHCPQALNPTASIAGLKRRAMHAYLKGEIKA